MRISVLFLLLLSMVACSSIKEPAQPQARQDADSMLSLAQGLAASSRSDEARESFSYALQMFEKFAGIDGQLSCLSGLCKLSLAEADIKGYQEIKAKMQDITREIAPELDYHLLLLNIYELQSKQDYAAISALSIAKTDYPLSVKIQLANAKLQADSYLKRGTSDAAKTLNKMALAYKKQLRKQATGNPELVSSAWYALAYYYFSNGDYALAINKLALVTDWDYRWGNNTGLGHAYWLQGQVQRKLNQGDLALASFRKAEIIFGAQNDSAALKAVTNEIIRLKGDEP
ncbi:MAG: hypothetical protein PHH43_03505 [Candidatus Cloacimonetes bacterium]|nr:hypothetical protein [Candidatus Cloacimonadota bacterium]